MKRVWTIAVTLTAILLISAYPLLAQRPIVDPAHRGCGSMMGKMEHRIGVYNIPNLTSEQISKIQRLKLEFQKEKLPLRTQLQIERLELQMLIAENVEQKKLEAKIDEISKTHAKLLKKRVAHHRGIRKLLTDEQKVYFDLRGFGMGRGYDRRGVGAWGHRSHKGSCEHSRMRGW